MMPVLILVPVGIDQHHHCSRFPVAAVVSEVNVQYHGTFPPIPTLPFQYCMLRYLCSHSYWTILETECEYIPFDTTRIRPVECYYQYQIDAVAIGNVDAMHVTEYGVCTIWSAVHRERLYGSYEFQNTWNTK